MYTTQTITTSTLGSEVVGLLNAKSAEGYDCTALTVPSKYRKKAELTFSPRAAGEVPYIYRKIEITSYLYQPEGWDFAFEDGSYIYIRRPQPGLCQVESTTFFDWDEKELTYLTEKAREGLMVAAVIDNQFLFVPCPAKDVTWRVDYGRVTSDGACYALPEQADTDGDGMYFICADDMVSPVRYSFANVPLSTEGMVPCGDALVPPDVWENRMIQKSARSCRTFCIAMLLSSALGSIADSFTADPMSPWFWGGLTALALLCFFMFPRILSKSEGKTVKKRLYENDGKIPRVSALYAGSNVPTTAEVLADPATHLSSKAQKKAWRGNLIGMLLLALFFSGVVVYGGIIAVSLFIGGIPREDIFSGILWLIGAILCLPLSIASWVATFKSLCKLFSHKKDQ